MRSMRVRVPRCLSLTQSITCFPYVYVAKFTFCTLDLQALLEGAFGGSRASLYSNTSNSSLRGRNKLEVRSVWLSVWICQVVNVVTGVQCRLAIITVIFMFLSGTVLWMLRHCTPYTVELSDHLYMQREMMIKCTFIKLNLDWRHCVHSSQTWNRSNLLCYVTAWVVCCRPWIV
jgi:hypothetical protein